MPYLDRLQHWAEVQPDATAVEVVSEVGADRLSYAQLRDRAASRPASTPPLTILCQPNGTDFVLRFTAGVAGGGCCAVLDPDWPEEQRAAVERRLLADAVRAAPQVGAAPGDLHDGPGESVFLYGFTSGTSAVPKAYTRTRRSWQLSFQHGGGFFGLTRADRTLALGPFSASLTLYALAESLHTGAAFFGLERFDVAAALACVTERRISRIVSAPAALRLFSERALAAGADGSALTGIVSAGATLDAATLAAIRRFAPNAAVYAYYGASELSFVAASVLRPGEPAGSAGSAVGRALPGVEIRIRSDAGDELPDGAPGTIFVRSELVGEGYVWGDDGEAFRRDGGWCTVGDRGFLDGDAVLHHLGRQADMIVTAGQNVYPQEVEAALQGLPGVDTAIVTGIPDLTRGTRVVAAVMGDLDADAGRLRWASASLLSPAKRPRAYFRLTELPLTAAGKISRPLLARWIEEGDARVRPLR